MSNASPELSVPPRLRGDGTPAKRLAAFAADIKLSHTIFALPWAVLAAFLAAGGVPRSGQLLLILLCMAAGRTMAMAANRLLDARLDALNPRTAKRAIPAGRLTLAFYMGAMGLCALLFGAAVAAFWLLYGNPWPVYLATPVLGFICAYPVMKRFTRLCHYYLGAALALAPVCAWLAIRGSLSAEPLWMAGAVLLWTAGFDIIYACQDYESDLKTRTYSLPARLGIAPSLWAAQATHLGCVAMLVLLERQSEALGTVFLIGVAAAAVLLVVEHLLVRADDLTRINLAFFTINGLVSVILGGLGVVDVFVANR